MFALYIVEFLVNRKVNVTIFFEFEKGINAGANTWRKIYQRRFEWLVILRTAEESVKPGLKHHLGKTDSHSQYVKYE